MFYCVEMEAQSPKICTEYWLTESGKLINGCNETVNMEAIKMPPICMKFVDDETLVPSDNQSQSIENKECKSILLKELKEGETTKK